MTNLAKFARIQKPGKPLMVIAGRTLTYGEQWSRCHALNDWVQQLGLPPGMPILLAVTDEFEQASLLLGLIVLGQPPLVFDPHATRGEAAVILGNSDFGAVIADANLRDLWKLDSYGLPCLQVNTKVSKGVFGRLLKKLEAPVQESSWPARVSPRPTPLELEVAPESLAYVVFTSGTTSTPKGVEITRAALCAQMSALVSQYGLGEDCQLLNPLPLHHVDGLLQGPLLAWVSGCTLFRPLPFSAQDIQHFMACIYRDRITHLIAVPTILALMLRLGSEWKENFTHESFRFIVSCAGHLEQVLWEALESTFAVPVVNMYGLSETGTSALFSGPDVTSRLVGTLGMPVNSRIRIVDGEGNDVEFGLPGELLISSPQLMRGYHRNPAASSAILRDGWLHSGDLGQQLDSGHVKYVGRLKNQIISGGRNISPEEVSACLNTHPNVLESIVFGRHDAIWGEQVAALAVVEKSKIDEAQLTEWCRTQLSEYKIPKHIVFVDQLEKGPSGKIRVDAARELFETIKTGSHVHGQNGGHIEETVLATAAGVFRVHQGDLSIDSDMTSTPGWDSLAHMTLILEIESALSVRFSAQEIMQVDSLAQLASICRGKLPA